MNKLLKQFLSITSLSDFFVAIDFIDLTYHPVRIYANRFTLYKVHDAEGDFVLSFLALDSAIIKKWVGSIPSDVQVYRQTRKFPKVKDSTL